MTSVFAVNESDVTYQQRLAHQEELERLYNKNQTLRRVKNEFTKEPAFQEQMNKHKIDIEFGYDLLVQIALHKRTTLSTMVAILRHHFEGMANGLQLTCDEVLKCIMADLVDWLPMTSQLIIRFEISPDVQAEIDMFQYPLPMVIPPWPVMTNKESGYLTSGGSIILRKNHHEDDVCLDHINRMNSIRFTINEKTATLVKNRWRNLDKPKAGETKEDFQKRVKAFEKYDRTAKEVMSILLKHSDDFYLTHKYDKRGRTYCQGYHVNYQGAPWNKAVIELADKELIE